MWSWWRAICRVSPSPTTSFPARCVFRSMSDTAELPVAAFRAIPGTTGQALPSPEQLSLDGVEYAFLATVRCWTSMRLVPRRFWAVRFGPNWGWCLWISISPDRNTERSSTQLRFEIWNENEVKFSGTTHCFEGMGWVDLSDLNGTTNHFRRQFLGTKPGKPGSIPVPTPRVESQLRRLVAWVLNDFGPGLSGRMLRSTGRQPSTIHIPTVSQPEESGTAVDRDASAGDGSVKARLLSPAVD